ncbi:MAG: ABC transporter substrate-binding protein [bacterium]
MIRTARALLQSFSASGKALFLFFAGLLIVSAIGLVYLLNQRLLVSVPTHGGSLAEGVVGAPRFINPVLAASDSDKDLTALVYSGLLKALPSGAYTPDLAESYSISADGKTYTVQLKPAATFQDGTPVTADDVLFTIGKIQNPTLKSPLRANWDGVLVTATGPLTVQFVVRQAYTPFIANLTLGILPKHLWDGVGDTDFSFSALNGTPVGSGPFSVGPISRNASGLPTSYTLLAFKHYTLGWPYLDSLVFHFYQNQNDLTRALKSGDIDSASGISPEALSGITDRNIVHSPQGRVFAVFFNQNQSTVLRDVNVRQALDDALDKDALVKDVLGGYGIAIDDPLPPSLPGGVAWQGEADISSTERINGARQELLKAGWTVGQDGTLQKVTGSGKTAKIIPLSFTLATGNVPELHNAALFVQRTWQQMGAKVGTAVYDQGDLSQNVIRPRHYDALLFGEVVGRQPDLYAFWHSSQRLDPGLNIALYANTSVDSALATLRTTQDASAQQSLYKSVQTALQKDIPALFLYTPDFVYTVPKDIVGVDLGFIETPSDRFLSVAQWHRETDSVWPIFASRR